MGRSTIALAAAIGISVPLTSEMETGSQFLTGSPRSGAASPHDLRRTVSAAY
jgi:hypothetical protein